MSRPGVLFDVDGTLVDTNYLHVLAWSDALRDHNYRVAMRDIHRLIGRGSHELLDALDLGLDEDEMDAISAAHSEHYRPLLDRVDPLPGAGELLRAVRARGLRVVLATSAKPHDVPALLAALDADDAIDDVVDSGAAERAKPDPQILQVGLERGHLDARRSVMVGDTVWDLEAAARAGVRCLALLTGGIGADELREAGAVEIFDNPAQLLEHLGESVIGHLGD